MGGPHRIKRQVVELRLREQTQAAAVQAEVSRACRSRMLALIERCCDELSPPGRLHRIDRLEIDLGRLDAERLEADWLDKFDAAFRHGLAEQIRQQDAAADGAAQAEAQWELFSGYLRDGVLPWWADRAQAGLPQRSLEWLLHQNPAWLPSRVAALVADARALRRLAGHFDAAALTGLVELAAPALRGFPQAWAGALALLPDYQPALAAFPAAQFHQARWQSLLANAVLAEPAPATRLDFARSALTRLAHSLGIPVALLLDGLAQAADRLAPEAAAVVRALAAERAGAGLQDLGESAVPAALREALAASLQMAGGAAQAALELLGQSLQPPPGQSDPLAALRASWLAWRQAVGGEAQARAEALSHGLQAAPAGPPPAPSDAILVAPGQPAESAARPAVLRGWLQTRVGAAAAMDLARPGAAAKGPRPENAGPAQGAPDLLKQGVASVKRLDPGSEPVLPPLALAAAADIAGGSPVEDALYLGNAGLVILWPFLAGFFARLGLLRKSQFSDPAARQRGVALLHCLATGEAEPPEYWLPLNKLLCGMDLDAVFELEPPLTPEETAECEILLEAVIAQAPILKQMSVPGFRGSFLLRAAVLEPGAGSWRLRVERETYDLVLERFPWSFGWVMLPWMATPLQVEW